MITCSIAMYAGSRKYGKSSFVLKALNMLNLDNQEFICWCCRLYSLQVVNKKRNRNIKGNFSLVSLSPDDTD